MYLPVTHYVLACHSLCTHVLFSGVGKEKTFIDYAIDYSIANAPMSQDLESTDIGNSAAFLLSPLSRAVTGLTLYVDNGLNVMGMALDAKSMEGANN